MVSKCRQNYHEESEALVNKQINMELSAHYQYLALVSFPKFVLLQNTHSINKLSVLLVCILRSRRCGSERILQVLQGIGRRGKRARSEADQVSEQARSFRRL